MAAKIIFGNSDIAGMYVGSSEVQSIWYGTTKVYEKSGGGGYNLTLNIIARDYDPRAWDTAFCIKANGTPSDEADWDYAFVLPYAGSNGWVEDKDGNELVDVGYDTGGTCTLSNINSITFWRNSSGTAMFVGVNSNTTAAPIWSSTQTITLSADTTITIYYDYDS